MRKHEPIILVALSWALLALAHDSLAAERSSKAPGTQASPAYFGDLDRDSSSAAKQLHDGIFQDFLNTWALLKDDPSGKQKLKQALQNWSKKQELGGFWWGVLTTAALGACGGFFPLLGSNAMPLIRCGAPILGATLAGGLCYLMLKVVNMSRENKALQKEMADLRQESTQRQAGQKVAETPKLEEVPGTAQPTERPKAADDPLAATVNTAP